MAGERNYLFDTFRGLLICSIPLSHFTRVGGHFSQDSLSGIVYITINVFVMQAFMFLSGYFSKKPARARESAFQTFMLPYLFFTFVFYLFRYWYFGNANLDFLKPPFALWFLFSVFFYRYFLVDLIRVKHLMAISVVVYLVAGSIPGLDTDYLALGRTISYFPFFLLGYYCTKERLESFQKLKMWQTLLLGAALLGVSYVLAFYVKIPVGFYLLKTTAADVNITWYADMIMRVVVFGLSVLWLIFMFNFLPSKKNYLTYIGMNTMPVYIFHLFVRYIVGDYGFPRPNWIVYYACVFGLATLCSVVFSSPPVAKFYDKTLELLYQGYLRLKKALIYEKAV